MSEPVFRGVGVALVTLFDEAGELDAVATAEHAARLVDLGIRAVVVSGSTGEAATLEPGERIALLEAVRIAVGGRAPVIAGTGAAGARGAARLTTEAREHGADAALVLSPPRTPDPRPYYDAVAAAAGDMPVLAYHFPRACPPGIPVELLADLPVAGCKDSTGDPTRLLETLTRWNGNLYVGSAALLAMAEPLGCAGAILALANAEPELCIRAFTGDMGAQLALAEAHLEAQRAFPAGIKGLTARRFGTSTVARMG